MSKEASFLSERLKMATHKLSSMATVIEKPAAHLSPNFRIAELTDLEKQALVSLLDEYRGEKELIAEDLLQLSTLTAEVKAINAQAILLHGERIKKAQSILKNYRDGAFTAWLIATYGNRQTPYNFLQYYELVTTLSVELQTKLDQMPRQAVYTLASREGSQEQKEEIIRTYQGAPKAELLKLIRKTFPLADTDRRAQDLPNLLIQQLQKVYVQLSTSSCHFDEEQKAQTLNILKKLKKLIIE